MRKASTKWHAVTVVLREASCAAAALCRSTRFLAGEAPRLPLNKCPHPDTCPCTYRHFEDRRGAPRRSADVGGGHDSVRPGGNRRLAKGRRATDNR
jgi:hypothetical protein